MTNDQWGTGGSVSGKRLAVTALADTISYPD
jgi:hypothetical protein